MKKLLKALLAIVVILIVLLLAHPIWIGPVARTAVSLLAPKFLGVPARMDGFSLNVYTGRVTLDGFALDNPPGCTEAKFVTIGHLCVDVEPMSVLSDPIVVEEISLKDFYLSLVTDAEKVYNYKTIAGGGSSDKKETAPEEAKPEKTEAAEKKPSPKVIIDLIEIQNALLQWERVPLPLPSFRLTGIGRETSGVKFEEAWNEVQTKFLSSLGPMAQSLQTSLTGLQGSMESGMKAANDMSNSAVNSTTKAMTDAQNAISSGTKQSVDAATKSVEEGVKSLKSLFGN